MATVSEYLKDVPQMPAELAGRIGDNRLIDAETEALASWWIRRSSEAIRQVKCRALFDVRESGGESFEEDEQDGGE